ncbi:glycosyltransferase WbuB [Aquimarina sp. AD10]|uniref:glycosyltransferase family 4 protein n=1 Tax=Aquimarina sp. AD10 TaxID=1714849 RepID=UPI000E4FBF80|nr:glycosyltransferase family 4 protein [Aquimarina sp. AD10]AXT61822.1 glycosyltransferase WbuB [Aquimarina sp. AD10]RKN02620.1 glycosyltransferase [Aquimarina sp. AD10]
MKKNVWIINQYITSPDIDGEGYRHYYIAKHLQKKEKYNTLLVTSSFSHAPYRHNKIRGLYKFVNKDIPTLILKGNSYEKSHGKGRILSWLIFSINLLIVPFISRKKVPKPDIIVLSSLPLLPILNILVFKRLFYPKCKFIFEIRDLWPLSAIELGNYSEKNVFMKFLSFLERLSYSKADTIISVIPRADIHIKSVLGHENFNYKWITNGFEIPIDDEIETKDIFEEKISTNTFNIGYAGTLVIANPLDTIIDVTLKLKENNIHFYILGGGPEKERLMEFAKGYNNIHFLDRVPKQFVRLFLSKMDVLFMGKGTKDTKIYDFGTSQLKTFDYFFAKKPIIQALNSKENPVNYSKSGYVIPPEDEESLRDKILYFKGLSEDERFNYGERGYNYLLKNCTYDKISNAFDEVFEETINIS